MGVSSMTGFGRATGRTQGFQWAWEVKSVNSKGLDIRVRVPSLVDGLDIAARKSINKRLERGSVSANLILSRDPGHETVVLREGALDELISVASNLESKGNLAPASIDGLLSIHGLVDIRDQQLGEAEQADLERSLLGGLDPALEALLEARRKEGEGLGAVLGELLQTIEDATRRAAASEGASEAVVRARFEAKLNDLMGPDSGLDENRLAQEIAVLVVKADIREEIDRLGLHVCAAKDLLEKQGPIGRQLEFLSQELVREANTICSKSTHMELTNIGLELKSAIDRFREQVQNIE